MICYRKPILLSTFFLFIHILRNIGSAEITTHHEYTYVLVIVKAYTVSKLTLRHWLLHTSEVSRYSARPIRLFFWARVKRPKSPKTSVRPVVVPVPETSFMCVPTTTATLKKRFRWLNNVSVKPYGRTPCHSNRDYWRRRIFIATLGPVVLFRVANSHSLIIVYNLIVVYRYEWLERRGRVGRNVCSVRRVTASIP